MDQSQRERFLSAVERKQAEAKRGAATCARRYSIGRPPVAGTIAPDT